MTEDRSSFVWPSASTLVRRAERELNLPPLPVAEVKTVDRFAALEANLFRYESSYIGLHPPGYESTGRFASGRRLFKKVIRRLTWWYVEPRWTVQREMTAALVEYSRESIDLLRAMSAEVSEVRTRVQELESLLSNTVPGRASELSGLNVEHDSRHDSNKIG